MNKKIDLKQKEISPNLEQQICPSIPTEEMDNESDLLIINNDDTQNTNYRYYQKEIHINENNKKTEINMKKPIYTKVRSDSFKPPFQKAKISKYIYRTQKPYSTNNLGSEYMTNNTNSKYSIKNPTKEKTKNKMIKSNSQGRFIINRNRNDKNLKELNDSANNTDIHNLNNNYNYNNIYNFNYNNNDEEINIINNTNYNFRPGKNLIFNINNTEFGYDNNIYPNEINAYKSKGGNISLNPIKKKYISFKRKANVNTNKIFHRSPRESHISFIYDYSQENNKDSYYVENPNVIKKLNIYPLKAKLKNRKKDNDNFPTFNNKSPKKMNDRLQKQIENSRLQFEKIREIEKKVKNYFNTNGLNMENRELYDQSATMIQSAFRAYYSRMKLYKELNSFINIGFLNNTLNKIFALRKSDYWENFLKGILNYLSFLNSINLMNNNKNTENIVDINYDKQIFNEQNFIKKIPKSYKKKKGEKQMKNNYKLLFPQSCISFNLLKENEDINKDNDTYINNINNNEKQKYLEEKLNSIILENEQLKKTNQNLRTQYENLVFNQENNNYNNIKDNNIIKDTQKSVELNIEEKINFPLTYSNKENNSQLLKKTRLKNIIKNKMFKMRENLLKYFFRFYYNAILIKNSLKPFVYTKNQIKFGFNSSSNNSNNEYSFREKKDDNLNSNERLLEKLKNLFIILDIKRKNIFKNKFNTFYFKGIIHEIKDNKNYYKNDTILNKNNENNELKNENIEVINHGEIKDD